MNDTLRWFALSVLGVLCGPLWAQMDMLPFLFRDVPKEFEVGVPADMTFEEFRQLNRRVDFFTVGMSMIWPGYASAQVERGDQAVILGGLRWGTYGMMAAAVGMQWSSWKNLWQSGELSVAQYDQVKTNAALFAVGGALNMFLWGADVLLAYHQAMEDRDQVIYRYGLARTVALDQGPPRESLRRLAVQDDPRLRPAIIRELRQVLADPSSASLTGEFSWYLGRTLARQGLRAQSMVILLRGLAEAPTSPWSSASRALALEQIKGAPPAWEADRELFLRFLNRPEPSDRISDFRLLPFWSSTDLKAAARSMAESYLSRQGYQEHAKAVLTLLTQADAHPVLGP